MREWLKKKEEERKKEDEAKGREETYICFHWDRFSLHVCTTQHNTTTCKCIILLLNIL